MGGNAPPPAGVPIGELRSAVRAQVDSTSRRSVAAEVGISPRGLWKFLEGARPQARTRSKLEQWYWSTGGSGRRDGGLSINDALALLLEGVPAKRRAAAEAELREAIEQIRQRHSQSPLQ